MSGSRGETAGATMSNGCDPAELVLLHLGRSTLALQRREVRDLLEPPGRAAGLDSGAARDAGAGATLRVAATAVPVLILDDALQPCAAAPAQRRICVLLEHPGRQFGVLCDEFEHRIDTARGRVKTHELPPAMRTPRTPVTGLLQIGETVALLTHARALADAFAVPADATPQAA